MIEAESSVEATFPLSPMRWVVLAIFSTMSLLQSLIWLTFGAIEADAHEVFGMRPATVTILAMYGPIWYQLMAFPMMEVYRRYGLRITCLLGAFFDLLCGIARCFALGKTTGSIIALHFGQAFNGLNGPIVLGFPTELSMTWFPPHERGFATAVALLANSLGAMVGFLWLPWSVETLGMIPMLRITGAVSLVLFLVMLFCFPHAPPSPPSASAAIVRRKHPVPSTSSSPILHFLLRGIGGVEEQGSESERRTGFGSEVKVDEEEEEEEEAGVGDEEESDSSVRDVENDAAMVSMSLWEGLRALGPNRDYWLLCLGFSVSCGAFCGWSGILSLILKGKPWNFTQSADLSGGKSMDQSVAWIGFWATFGSVTGGIVSGLLMDRFGSHRKLLLLFCGAGALVYTLWAMMYMQVIPATSLTLLLLGSVGSFFINGTGPLFMELAAEVTYPVSESISGGLVQFLINVVTITFQLAGLSPQFRENPTWLNWALPGAAVIALVTTLFVSNTARRLDIDEGKQGRREAIRVKTCKPPLGDSHSITADISLPLLHQDSAKIN